MEPTLKVDDFKVYKHALDGATQRRLVEEIRTIATAAPLFSPVTRWGKPMSVQMTSAGKYGWYSDRRGYRYEPQHPSGVAWPAIPTEILDIWHRYTGLDRAPDCCLVNYYREKARMGLHQDIDEADFSYPVLSISLGDSGLFRIGGTERSDSTQSIWLMSGDVVVMGGTSRKAFHGIDKIKFGTSDLLSNGGRINLTLRVVD